MLYLNFLDWYQYLVMAKRARLWCFQTSFHTEIQGLGKSLPSIKNTPLVMLVEDCKSRCTFSMIELYAVFPSLRRSSQVHTGDPLVASLQPFRRRLSSWRAVPGKLTTTRAHLQIFRQIELLFFGALFGQKRYEFGDY